MSNEPEAEPTSGPRPAAIPRASILTINGGSSSLKFALFASREALVGLLTGKIERIGRPAATMKVTMPGLDGKDERPVTAGSPAEAALGLVDWLKQKGFLDTVAAIGHRVVHGGEHHVEDERVTPALIDDLKALVPLDPDHLPGEVALIEAFAAKLGPDAPQYVCFDTKFHRDLPRVARILPIPRKYEAKGVRRYGFHGLSFEYLVGELTKIGESQGRVILAHLGSGASLAAVRDGKCVDTSMGFTPTAGLVMGTRAGDLDPGLAGYLARSQGMSAEQFDTMVNKESGLLGVSETSADVRDLLAKRAADPRADLAIELFCYQARKWIGAFAAALGGLDTLVFSGGIGENSPEIRARICEGLGFLGIRLDPERNLANDSRICTNAAPVAVRVIPTDEELTIARSVAHLVAVSELRGSP